MNTISEYLTLETLGHGYMVILHIALVIQLGRVYFTAKKVTKEAKA